ncbi:NAD(P)/FAD-dependent oxidoreductase [Saccharothrix longispora]|uniref:NAD/FAD-dependent oxidoreductase n=1 Tax=Saccharothrix longispora TaxID=33920 RepID=A0ABU1PNL3_9PSEU|nr:NAD(P)/FAD-dependent oxidoreductase [Saccharothrix longispora]MDR6592262.1 putative NAD/FAD-dependent oxidoreductase [Saccharothrix longispora]
MGGVVVVGAGLAGLNAARVLARAGVASVVLDAGDEVGGRVRTDVVDGVRFDRGFQILLPAYPELADVDLDALDLRHFRPGAFVHRGGRRDLLADPRDGLHAIRGALGQRVLGVRDLVALAGISLRDLVGPVRAITSAPDRTTREELGRWLSDDAVDTVLRPFLAGVFLERELTTSSRFFHLVWRSFARGGAALPALGMAELPRLLARGLDVRLGARVVAVRSDGVELAGGERVAADHVVIATDGSAADRLWPGLGAPAWHGVTTWYFRPPAPPLRDPTLVVDGDGGGPVVNTAVLSEVSRAYSPDAPLVQASVLDEATEAEVRSHLGVLYGTPVTGWETLARYDVPHALPVANAPHPLRGAVRLAPRRYVCGDHRDTPSIQGALVSGRRAARAVLADLGVRQVRGDQVRGDQVQ